MKKISRSLEKNFQHMIDKAVKHVSKQIAKGEIELRKELMKKGKMLEKAIYSLIKPAKKPVKKKPVARKKAVRRRKVSKKKKR